jgi:hypothetical protein
MSYDPAAGNLVLFGGEGSSSYLNDTWSYGAQATSPTAAPSSIGQSAGNTTATIIWVDVPTSMDGGSPITSYTAEVLSGTTVVATTSVAPGTEKATFNSLTNGTTYTMKVVAVNGVGTGPYATSAAVVPSATPGVPTNVVGTPVSNGSVDLTWTAPSANGSSITSYTISLVQGTGASGFPITTNTAATSYSIAASEFTAGNSYTLSVAATNANGTGGATNSNSFVIPTPPPPPAPPQPGCSSTGVGSANFPGGYWLATANGAVYSCGDAPFYGSLVTLGITPSKPIVGIAATPDNKGYWLVASDGGLFAFGDAKFYGSMGGKPLNEPVVGMTATPQGGYYEVASDGGLFAFGPGASFCGSMGGKPLNEPVVGMAETPAGGYYEVASDGGLFAFGPGTPFLGSMGGKPLNKPVVGMAVDPTGGYYEVASDGGIFSFGTAFHGSTGCLSLNQPIVAMVVSPDTTTVGTGTACGFTTPQSPGGYRFVASDGGVFSFGNAVFAGSLGGLGVTDVVGIAGS